MRAISDKFLRSLTGSYTMTVRAQVVFPGQEGTAPIQGTEIDIFRGEVNLDSTADIRSWLTLETDGDGLFPDNADDLWAVYGDEVFIQVGINYGGQASEWVSLGYFRINTVSQNDHPQYPLTITAQDRMANIIDARITDPWQFTATETYGDIVMYLVDEALTWSPTIEWDDDSDIQTIGRTLIAEEDRFGFLNDLVTSLGKIWYWDYRGVLVIKDPPSEDEPVWTVNAGENGILFSLTRELTRNGVYNAVVAYGEALDTLEPSRYLAVDDNPDSPTFWYGNFGHVPMFYFSPFITTDAQAESAAKSLLRQNLGVPYNVDFSTVINPALEPWDPVLVQFEDKNQVHIIEKIRIPLGEVPEPMTATTRQQTLVILGEG